MSANQEIENLKEIARSKEAELREVQRIRRDLEKRAEAAEKEAANLKDSLVAAQSKIDDHTKLQD